MRDYWLNKLFFDLQQPDLAAQYKKDRAAVLARYPMSAELRRAVESDDIATHRAARQRLPASLLLRDLRHEGRRVHPPAERNSESTGGAKRQRGSVTPWLVWSAFTQPVTAR